MDSAPPNFKRAMSRVARVCSQCGYKDNSPIPPAMCPQCHFQPEGAATLVNARPMANRKERRAQAAKNRLQQRKVNKQIARESGGHYEAS